MLQLVNMPDEIPSYIQMRIAWKHRSIGQLAKNVGLPYSTVYSVLITGGAKALNTVFEMAGPLGVEPDEMAEILLIIDIEKRKAAIKKLLNGKSMNQLAKECRVSQPTISNLLTNEINQHIRNVYRVARGLNMTLGWFANEYCEHAAKKRL